MERKPSARERVRVEMVEEIKSVARTQLAIDGAAALSLRAVAREVGMVSSAIYRYFPSRDELLTALIVDAYNAVGLAAESADAAVRRSDLVRRWVTVGHAVRNWARANMHEYGLVYGTPIPRYRAPEDTIGPASRVTRVLVDIVRDAHLAGRIADLPSPTIPRAVRHDLATARAFFDVDVSDDVIVRSLMAWTHVFGAVSFELFGHRVGTIADNDAFFDHELRRLAAFVGIE